MLDLPVRDRRTAGQFSKGMKMRLALARSLLNRPRLWFLDEPTSGQDPGHSVAIRRLILARREAGTTVFLTTHDMTVADELCDRVALIVAGRIATVGTPRQLKLQHATKRVRVEYRASGVEGTAAVAAAEFELDDRADKARFLAVVRDHDVWTIHTSEPTLEEAFLRLTGSSLGAGQGRGDSRA
jgi:fluoroquinolone transport system ATP-binding protein